MDDIKQQFMAWYRQGAIEFVEAALANTRKRIEYAKRAEKLEKRLAEIQRMDEHEFAHRMPRREYDIACRYELIAQPGTIETPAQTAQLSMF